MHDLSLGPPVEVDRAPEAKHAGPCFDGVYGCHRCWNAANDCEGTLHTCDSCGKEALTRVCRASDEPVLYAWCKPCRERIFAARAREAMEEEQRHEDYLEAGRRR